MRDKSESDWDPKSDWVLRDQQAAYDEMRERCPVAHSDLMQWSLFRHEDVTRVLYDHETFSNAVSHHLSVPNGIDPPKHTAYRSIIEPYFAPERMRAFEPICRDLATKLVRDMPASGEVELMADLALPFAVRAQCAFLGWPPALHSLLVSWTQRNYQATLAQDRQVLSELALEFQTMIDNMLKIRIEAGANPEDDVTAALMHERLGDRPLGNEEIASILRNWTVGEIGTISAAVGIVVHYLAQYPELMQQLRTQPLLLPAAIDEILRIRGPLVANRRITTCPVEIGGRQFEAGERLSLNWISANRDGRVFKDPDSFRLDRDPANNLLYGAGIHVCPGAPLARLELQMIVEELLKGTDTIEPVPGKPPVNAIYPAAGFFTLPMKVKNLKPL